MCYFASYLLDNLPCLVVCVYFMTATVNLRLLNRFFFLQFFHRLSDKTKYFLIAVRDAFFEEMIRVIYSCRGAEESQALKRTLPFTESPVYRSGPI